MSVTNSFPYKKFTDYLINRYNERIQKIPINLGLNCPNRDGKIGNGGCIFCNNQAFIPFYANDFKIINKQIEEGIAFFSKKYAAHKFLLYFQAYTNTYTSNDKLFDLLKLTDKYPEVKGVIFGTRPDCLDIDFLTFFNNYAKNNFAALEIGIETFDDGILSFINRGHNSQQTIEAFQLLEYYSNILIGAHLIIGLPNFTKQILYNDIKLISELKIDYIKFHHLQIIKDTTLAKIYESDKNIELLTVENYINLLCDSIELLNPAIYIDRLINEVPSKYLIAPIWNGKRHNDINEMLIVELKRRNSFQGCRIKN